jgi:endonuclease YncB( thermonuclease family)
VVIDGDTLEIDGDRHRLFAIDAPELAQRCMDTQGRDWACGRAAADQLAKLISTQQVSCRTQGKDYYGRYLSVCFAAEIDINSFLVRQGLAWAFLGSSPAGGGIVS